MNLRRLDVRLAFGVDAAGRVVPPRVIGTLVQSGPRIHFGFDDGFIARPLPVSPYRLPVGPGVWIHHERAFDFVPGLVADSLPDGWGKLVQDRLFASHGIPRERVTALDRLGAVGAAGMGALTFRPVMAPDGDEEAPLWPLDLEALAAQSMRVLQGSAEELLPVMRVAGGSPAGARPKVLAGLCEDPTGGVSVVAGVTPAIVTGRSLALPPEYAPYLIKFGSDADVRELGRDVAAVEEAYARMARAAGMDVPETRLLVARDGSAHFAIRRFDRHGPGGAGRLHMHTLAGLLHASHWEPSLDYTGYLGATAWLTGDRRATVEAFRRTVFNVLAHNRDDHTKNFAYLMDAAGAWSLAPAYDLTFSTGPNGHHSTSVAGESLSPTRRHLRDVAASAGLSAREADVEVARVADAVGQWSDVARTLEIAPTVAARLEGVFTRLRRAVLPTSSARG